MTINTTANRKEYTGNGVTTAFSFPYYFLADADLVVIETVIATGVQTTKTLTTHYTVSGAGNPAGGTVTMLAAPASTVTLTIYRDPSAVQDVDLVEGDPLPVETALEQPLDKLTMIVQRVKELIERALRLPEGDTGFVAADMELPAKVDRASLYLAFDANGKPVAVAGTTSDIVVTAFIETVLDDASGPAAMTTLHDDLVAETSPATDDELFLYDLSATTVDKITLANLLKVINALTADGSPDHTADYVVTYDANASAVKKVLLQNLQAAASETVAGKVELATTAEAAASADTSRAVTAAGVKAALDKYTPGLAQTWQNVTGSRALATNYENTNDAAISVAVRMTGGAAGAGGNAYVGSANPATMLLQTSVIYGVADVASFMFLVPPGWFYRIDGVSSGAIDTWLELKA